MSWSIPRAVVRDDVTATSVHKTATAAHAYYLERPRFVIPSAAHLWADGGYASRLVAYARPVLRRTVEVVRKPPDQHGFEARPLHLPPHSPEDWHHARRMQRRETEDEMDALETVESQLVLARVDARRLAKLTRDLDATQRALDEERSKVNELAAKLADEEHDVVELEGCSLRGWLLSLGGSKQERLLKERQEAAAAKLQHDAAQQVAVRLADEVARLDAKVQALGDPNTRFVAVMNEKEALLTAAGDDVGQRLTDLAARRADAEADRRELGEAIAAGEAVQRDLEELAGLLDRANALGVWDLFGGGMFVTMVKQGYLDGVRSLAVELQEKIFRFDRELADVTNGGLPIGAVDLGPGLRFADVFLDGIIFDWLVQSRIEQARQTIYETAVQVHETLTRLDSLVVQADQAIWDAVNEREQLLQQF